MTKTPWQQASAIFADCAKFAHIPDRLIMHAQLAYDKGTPSRLGEELLRNPSAVSQAIDAMFDQASRVTSLLPAELLALTDFHHRDASSSRLGGAFAEIRAVNILDQEGFRDIQLLKAKASKSADIVARRNSDLYAVEVANSSYDAAGRGTPSEIKDWLIKRYSGDSKASQLASTARDYGCQRRVFVAIMDNQAAVIWQVHEEFLEAAKLAWHEAGKEMDLHFCIFTGRVALGHGSDNCAFPPWP